MDEPVKVVVGEFHKEDHYRWWAVIRFIDGKPKVVKEFCSYKGEALDDALEYAQALRSSTNG